MGPEGSDSVGEPSELALPFFYHSTPGPYSYSWEQSGIYKRVDDTILGEAPDLLYQDGSQFDLPRCFNCGSTEHKIPDCPLRPNRELIALSRQFYQFYQSTAQSNYKRIHTVEAWRQQRLNWVDDFEPGAIKGELLLDALVYGNDELLMSICAWGYPLGWISDADPRERMRARIWSENGGGVDDADDITVFEIHGEDTAIERVSFDGAFEFKESRDTLSETSVSTASPSQRDVQREPLRRWATYPNTYFSSEYLSSYTPPPPPMPPSSWDDTSLEDTEEYLNQHIPRAPPPPAEAPPPLPPPPPPDCPPPLPCLPSDAPPPIIFSPPLPSSPINSNPLPLLDRVDVNSESDMELSDSD